MFKTVASVAVLAATVFAIPAAHAGSQDFSLINRTGYQIDEVYVSRTTSRNWGGDIMGSDALENGRNVNVTFNAPDGVCNWDMKVKYNDGDEANWKGLNICSISKVTLYWDKKNEVTRAVTE
jgi:hypothetical protein